MGGLGLRSTEQHSSAAFLSSQAACQDLCRQLDHNYLINPLDQQADTHKAAQDYNHKVTHDDMLQGDLNSWPRQQVLSLNIDKKAINTIRENAANNIHFQADLNHTTASGAGS